MPYYMLPDLKKMKDGEIVVPKTKASHPYSYDPIVQFQRSAPEGEQVTSAYSDRMHGWHPERFRALQSKHFGNQGDYWDNRSPEAIEAFLKDYFATPDLQLISVVEYCNQATGYPVWHFSFVRFGI